MNPFAFDPLPGVDPEAVMRELEYLQTAGRPGGPRPLPPITVEFDPLSAYFIASALQGMLTHPSMAEHPIGARTIEHAARGLEEHLRPLAPALASVLRAGWAREGMPTQAREGRNGRG